VRQLGQPKRDQSQRVSPGHHDLPAMCATVHNQRGTPYEIGAGSAYGFLHSREEAGKGWPRESSISTARSTDWYADSRAHRIDGACKAEWDAGWDAEITAASRARGASRAQETKRRRGADTGPYYMHKRPGLVYVNSKASGSLPKRDEVIGGPYRTKAEAKKALAGERKRWLGGPGPGRTAMWDPGHGAYVPHQDMLAKPKKSDRPYVPRGMNVDLAVVKKIQDRATSKAKAWFARQLRDGKPATAPYAQAEADRQAAQAEYQDRISTEISVEAFLLMVVRERERTGGDPSKAPTLPKSYGRQKAKAGPLADKPKRRKRRAKPLSEGQCKPKGRRQLLCPTRDGARFCSFSRANSERKGTKVVSIPNCYYGNQHTSRGGG